MGSTRFLLLATMLSGALVACGAGSGSTVGPGSDPTGVPAPTTSTEAVRSGAVAQPGQLIGRTFRSTAVVVDGAEHRLVADTSITVTFRDTTIGARAGCNALEGSYKLVDGVLTVEQLGTTLMACDGRLMAQDQWVAAQLTAGPTLSLAGDTLSIAAATTRITLVDAAATTTEGRPLVGTTWEVDTLFDGPSASSMPAGVQPTMRIEGTSLAFDTGCNTGGATVRVEGEVLQVGNAVVTAKGCEGAAGSVEGLVLAVLNASPTFHIDGDRLRLDAGEDRGLGLRARP